MTFRHCRSSQAKEKSLGFRQEKNEKHGGNLEIVWRRAGSAAREHELKFVDHSRVPHIFVYLRIRTQVALALATGKIAPHLLNSPRNGSIMSQAFVPIITRAASAVNILQYGSTLYPYVESDLVPGQLNNTHP